MNILKFVQIYKIKDNYKRYFSLARKSTRLSKRFIDIIEQNIEDYSPGAKRLCIALFVQTVRLLEASLLLCQKGLDEEAHILTRSLVENTSYLIFILERDHEERTALYMHSRALSSFSVVQRLNEYVPEGEEKLDINSFSQEKEKAIAYFRNKYGEQLSEKDIKRKYALRPQNAVEKLEGNIKEIFLSTYGIFYSPASAVAHGEAPLNFLKYKNNKLGLKKWSSGRTTKMCLQSAILFTLYSLDGLLNMLNIAHKENIDSMINELFIIIKNSVRSPELPGGL